MDASAWATWAGAGVALIAAGVASVQAGRANKAARRSADADERAAAAAERANELAEHQAAKYVPDWRLVRLNAMSCQLTNASDEDASEVTVTRLDGSALWFPEKPLQPEDLQPRERMTVVAPSQFFRTGENVLVTWLRPNGERREQRVAIPGE